MPTCPAIYRTDASQQTYLALLDSLSTFGSYEIEQKKTCTHLSVRGVAFLGVHPRKNGVRLTLPMARALDGERIVKSEQTSKSRFHNDLDLSGAVDAELLEWIQECYILRLIS